MTDKEYIPITTINDKVALLQASSPDMRELSEKEKQSLNKKIEEAKAKQGIVEFTDEEIKTMPKNFRRLIIIQKKRCRLRTHASGKNSTTYEIRFRRDGYDISASGVTIELAKQNFIEKLKTAKPKNHSRTAVIPTTFTAFSLYFFDNFRKEKVSPLTYKFDSMRLRNYLHPYFKETQIKKITPSECKKLLDRVKAEGKGKTAEELYSIMSILFKGAIAHSIIDRNPLDTVLKTTHEKESGTALTKTEETTLLNAVNGTVYESAVALALYCGLRPNELKTACIRDNFILTVNSKRKTKKTEYKKIPIINKLRVHLPENGKFYIPDLNKLRAKIKSVLPNHKLYDLRTTFYSRCKECNVSEYALKEFAGHSLGALGNAYTDLSDEYLLKEGEKLNLW